MIFFSPSSTIIDFLPRYYGQKYLKRMLTQAMWDKKFHEYTEESILKSMEKRL